jgi:hypothetical protein
MALARMRRRAAPIALAAVALGLGATACSDAPSGATVATEAVATGDLGGYRPGSDVAATAGLSGDMVTIDGLLEADDLDAGAIDEVYAEGAGAPEDRGSATTLRALATADRDEPIWTDYVAFYEDRRWLDTFVRQALTATGPFDGASADVRRQAIQKGIRDGVMVATVIHALVGAEAKVAADRTDPADGAPHEVDQAWALYRGEHPTGAPFATAQRLGVDAGAGGAVNRTILARMRAARAAAAAGDAGALKAADDEIIRQILITYIRAALKYAAASEAALADGDEAGARVAQAEGLALYRVIAPLVAGVDEAAARTALDAFDIQAGPRPGMSGVVARALQSAYVGLVIERAEIGTPGG